MYLKSIELFGFKSFMERTKVKLDGGVACIVGPNGSGKSNIADAVRWVLGEQSVKTLRGQKMEDVIFAGSSKRKPLGMAEVVLNMDNSDGSLPVEFQEVSVARRVYRSGDSEYLLNGKQCRLKDIQELFMDSGVGNNSLALVGQGRVQEIVNMKPDERRGLIEEAAGVIKVALTFCAALFFISIPKSDFAVDFKTLSNESTESFAGSSTLFDFTRALFALLT